MAPLLSLAQTEIQDVGDASADDFLARERALLGEDATQFTTGNESAALADPSSDDLLGGGGETAQFESAFPEINTSNEVSDSLGSDIAKR